ncbi:hypothetical protein [Paludisphaera borealis]|uniref:Uncharacterized protein n=1 Tax=Paludisphaera borealis TaxID=1387353 RepID=A0A1U7CKV8_9BACT|nr:hypothetical protein [Paludisphaera borealis]APW59547.1 hypothetical protein BSF38_00971 [Paludisphaera borealis]
MPYISELEPSEAAGAKSSTTVAWDVPKGITPGFNLALFAYSTLWGLFQFLFLSEKAQNFPVAGLILSSALDFVRFTVLMLISAGFVQAFWRRLVAQIAPVRPIDFQEALAIVLIISILF